MIGQVSWLDDAEENLAEICRVGACKWEVKRSSIQRCRRCFCEHPVALRLHALSASD